MRDGSLYDKTRPPERCNLPLNIAGIGVPTNELLLGVVMTTLEMLPSNRESESLLSHSLKRALAGGGVMCSPKIFPLLGSLSNGIGGDCVNAFESRISSEGGVIIFDPPGVIRRRFGEDLSKTSFKLSNGGENLNGFCDWPSIEPSEGTLALNLLFRLFEDPPYSNFSENFVCTPLSQRIFSGILSTRESNLQETVVATKFIVLNNTTWSYGNIHVLVHSYSQ